MASVDSTARVHPEVQLESDVTVGPGAVVEKNVIVGRGSQIHPNAIVHSGSSLGEEVVVGVGAVVGGAPQDLKFHGGESGVKVGDRTVIREYVTVHRCVETGHLTTVGSDCLLMATSHVAHECVLGDGVIVANGVMMAGHVTIDDGAFLSGNVVIHQFTHIGRLAMIGGGSAVRQDVVPFCVADGHPARPRGLNTVGLHRAGIGAEKVRFLKRAYRLLFGSRLPMGERLQRLRELAQAEPGVPEVGEMLAFVEASERGIARPRG